MALMNVYDKLVMGPDAGVQEGAIQKKWFKHVGELTDTSKAKVVIVYRTVPDEPNNCLVVGTKFLPDMYHDALMRAIESEGGQSESELGPYLGRQSFPDGTNMLAILHNDNYIKKFPTKDITVTYGPLAEGRIALNKLNQMIARDQGVKVSELAIKDDTPKAPEKKVETTTEKSDAKKTTKK
jgi:hypothetical protein